MIRLLAAAGLSLASSVALAGNFNLTNLNTLTQPQFQHLAEDMGAAFSYKPLEPADPLGPLGVDVGAVVTGTALANTADVQQAVGTGNTFTTLPVPGLRITKGLPFNVDVGATYSRIPSSGTMNVYGAEVKWAILSGNAALPAVALRGTFTRMNGVNQLSFESGSADVSISKGFLLFTPYGGVGQVRSRVATDGLLNLSQVNTNQTKVFGGVNFNLGLTNVAVEADSTGGIASYSAKVGFRF